MKREYKVQLIRDLKAIAGLDGEAELLQLLTTEFMIMFNDFQCEEFRGTLQNKKEEDKFKISVEWVENE